MSTARSRGRSALFCGVLVVLQCARLSARAEPLRLRGDALAAARSPAGFLILRSSGDISSGIDAEALVWTGSGEFGGEAEALVATLRLHDPAHRGEARIGRLVMATGALRPVHMDGLIGLLRLPWDGTVELFGGLPVVPRLGSRSYDWMVGGRIAQQFASLGTVGVGYLHRRDLGRLSDEEVGVDFFAAPIESVDLVARAAYDLTSFGFSEAFTSLGVRAQPFRAALVLSHRSPSRILPATSLFSVLGDIPSEHLGLDIDWGVAPRLDLSLEAGARTYDHEVGEDLTFSSRLELDELAAGWIGLELRRQLGWFGIRAFGHVPLTAHFALSAELELALEERGSVRPWALGAIEWQPEDSWRISAAIEASASPEYIRAIDAILRATYLWSTP